MTSSAGQFDADQAIATFREAARLNLEDPYRKGAMIRLPGYGQVVMTGDLHGHRKNLAKLEKYAMLDRVTARHVILHEIVHADVQASQVDHSHEALLEAARYKCEFPDQVHFLQSNHELAQLTDYPIAKNGRAVLEDFNAGVATAYGANRASGVLAAISEFIASFPLAARTENRVWLSHSLPNFYDMDEFSADIFNRQPTIEDLHENRSIFHMVWGRRYTVEQLEALSQLLDVDLFITGHQPQEMGYAVMFDRLIILASDHNHGSFLPFDLSKKQTAPDLIRNIRKFVAVA
ncbi:MAG TPA: metallophosphoesterase [Phycisphaerae bacterium]|nr:metallophosphoesterase [Phycisphaerae bacterium]